MIYVRQPGTADQKSMLSIRWVKSGFIAVLFLTLFIGVLSQNPTTSLINSSATVKRNTIVANQLTETRLGFDCGLGTTQAVPNATGVPVAPTENGNPEILTGCTWIGDAGQTVTGVNDGTSEPLVTDQDELLSAIATGIGGGFTANVVVLQNSTAYINGFDLQVEWNPAILRAVEFDQTGLEWRSGVLVTPIQTIDNTNGVAELEQVIQGTQNGNVTIFRIRFDVVGVGHTNLHIVNITGGLAPITVHQTVDSSFDSETLFDAGHTLNWNANITAPTPLVPGSSNTFRVNSSCPGCTGPFTFSWQFNSTSTGPFKSETTGNPVTITMPNSTFLGLRLAVIIKDSAPTPHNVTLTMNLPFTVAIQGPTSASVGSSASWKGFWLGGDPSYTGKWRFCPAVAVCSSPSPTVPSTQKQNSTSVSVTYNFAGAYNDTLTITDSSHTSSLGSDLNSLSSILVNVTGAPPAYTVSLGSNPTVPVTGVPITITATVAYNAAYPLASQTSSFIYTISFGDGNSTTLPLGQSSTPHTYTSAGTYTLKIVARELSTSKSPSQIQEVGFTTLTVVSPITASFSPSLTTGQTGQSITFQSSASGGTGSYTYAWDFGDGDTSSDANPSHSYTTAGTYNVTLTVTDSSGRNFTTKQTVTISLAPPPSNTLYIIIGAVVVIGLVGTLIFLRMRRKPRAT